MAKQQTSDDRAAEPARRMPPPPRQDRLAVWLVLAVMLLMASAPLLMEIYRPDATDPEETRSVLIASETWHRSVRLAEQDPYSLERFVPRLHHQIHMDSPPGQTWIDLIAFSLLDEAKSGPVWQVTYARLASVAMALLAVAAVFWAGYSLDRLPAAAFAAMAVASCPLFVLQGRLATQTMPHLAFGMLAIAAALWAVRPLRPLPSTERQFIGWITCGLALGVATLVTGPITLATVIAPIFLFILLCPDRIGHLIGLLAALLIAVLLVAPWLVYAHEQNAQAWATWLGRITVIEHYDMAMLTEHARQRLAMLGWGLAPWLPWGVAAVVQPWSRSSKGRRLRLTLGVMWFVLLLALILPMPTTPQAMDLLPLAPAAAVTVAQLFGHYAEMAASGRYVLSWRLLRWPYLALLVAASILVPAGLVFPQKLVAAGLVQAGGWANPGVLFAVGLGAVLLILTAYSAHGVVRHYPTRTFVLWSVWWLMLMTVLTLPMTRGAAAIHPLRCDAQKLREALGDGRGFWLQREVEPIPPDPGLLLYAGHSLSWLRLTQISTLIEEHDASRDAAALFLVTPLSMPPMGSRFTPVMDLPAAEVRLWRLLPSSPAAATAPSSQPAESHP
ncbi:MAG: hypothetical protein IT440_02585 [Phycisphaeraceae bacterium]|nr:hypothetical protein [Phycisphaeraceae bacterium]